MTNQAVAVRKPEVAVAHRNGRDELIPWERLPPMPVIDGDRRALWEQLFFKGIQPAEMEFCIAYAAHRNLDPIRGEIVFNRFEIREGGRSTGRYSVVPVVTAIGYRVQAVRTGEYQGQTPREWCGPDGVWKQIWDSDEPPVAARVGVRRAGFPEPQYAVAMFRKFAKRYNPRQGQTVGDLIGVWKTNPDVMLATRAETAAFKLAFPESSDADTARSRQRAAIRALPGSNLRTIDGALVYAGDTEMGAVFTDMAEASAIAERDLWSEANRNLHRVIGQLHPDEDTHTIVHDLICQRFGLDSIRDATPEQLNAVAADYAEQSNQPDDVIEAEATPVQAPAPDADPAHATAQQTKAIRSQALRKKLSSDDVDVLLGGAGWEGRLSQPEAAQWIAYLGNTKTTAEVLRSEVDRRTPVAVAEESETEAAEGADPAEDDAYDDEYDPNDG